MVAGVVAAARRHGLDAVSFAPRIIAPGAGARWLQPGFLATLVFRFGAAGAPTEAPERAMANGQCLLMRRDVLERAGGYRPATTSYCDDVRIVRHLGSHGARVGFLDGRELLDVEMYPTGRETWRAWPRSLNLRDATSTRWRWFDALVLVLGQALPLPMLLLVGLTAMTGGPLRGTPSLLAALATVNALLLGMRVLLGIAMAPSFAPRGAAYWLSPLADPATALRVVATMFTRPREWRGATGARAA
jgi:dolichol-phosphate mannosyltransferase